MKLNWGHGLTLAIIAFGGMICCLVYLCTQTNYDLVSNEYYKDELAYQQVIDGTRNANALSATVNVKVKDGQVVIRLPREMEHAKVKGDILFYCVTDARRDKSIPLQPDQEAVQQIPASELMPGTYTVKIMWKSNDQSYYTEQKIRI